MPDIHLAGKQPSDEDRQHLAIDELIVKFLMAQKESEAFRILAREAEGKYKNAQTAATKIEVELAKLLKAFGRGVVHNGVFVYSESGDYNEVRIVPCHREPFLP